MRVFLRAAGKFVHILADNKAKISRLYCPILARPEFHGDCCQLLNDFSFGLARPVASSK